MSEIVRPRLARVLIESMVKHLPPSASSLRLLDVNGAAGEVLKGLRGDLDVVSVSGAINVWATENIPSSSFDAVVAFGYILNDDFLSAAMAALRPGGRLIVVNSQGDVSPELGKTLEHAGYARILVETAAECPLPVGVLMRGEKIHTTDDTFERIQQVAGLDSDSVDWADYKGRYVHLLIVQTPNKPVWNLAEGEQVSWQAVTVERENGAALLAFSSLPKAVGFMQPAVMNGRIHHVNKVGKFSREAAAGWTLPVLLNPDLRSLGGSNMSLVTIDVNSAEASDE
ncbi:MAG: hypothetical protein H7Y09_03650 [Chitinophagaceae bacterium]|nr:hypothetical protein [Anaerolineae bacterium]